MHIKSNALLAMLAMAIVVGASSRADAALILTLSSGGSSVTVTDGGVGDANPVAGAVTYIGAVGTFTVNASTGLSKPILPNTPDFASMDLSSVNVSTGAGSLLIELTDTDFLATGPGKLIGAVGGTTNGTTEFWAEKCAQDIITISQTDCQSLASVHLGPFTGAFSGTDSDAHGALDPYAMTLRALITHGSEVRVSSFDFEVKNVPEPAAIGLFGLGLLAAAALTRRRRAAR